MTTQTFSDIPRIECEGPKSKNSLAFKYRHADEKVDGKSMRDRSADFAEIAGLELAVIDAQNGE